MIYSKQNMFSSKLCKGFTLIELMVVIAIIGILTAIMTANFAAAKSKSRDAKRISDLSQIQLSLAAYFDRCNTYPAPDFMTGGSSFTTSCSGGNVSMSTFISRIPSPPTASETYYYFTNTSAYPTDPVAQDDYFLESTLENNGTASNNSMTTMPGWYPTYSTGSANPPSNFVCDTAKIYCIGPK